jgi:hypothetical protein
MATLNPFGLLILLIALSVAPPTADQVSVQLSEYSHMTFTRSAGGWWSKPDDMGVLVYFRREGTNVVAKAPSYQEAEREDLSRYFELTGGENWTRPTVIRTKPPEKKAEVRTQVQKDRLIARVTLDGTTHESIVTWRTRK